MDRSLLLGSLRFQDRKPVFNLVELEQLTDPLTFQAIIRRFPVQSNPYSSLNVAFPLLRQHFDSSPLDPEFRHESILRGARSGRRGRRESPKAESIRSKKTETGRTDGEDTACDVDERGYHGDV